MFGSQSSSLLSTLEPSLLLNILSVRLRFGGRGRRLPANHMAHAPTKAGRTRPSEKLQRVPPLAIVTPSLSTDHHSSMSRKIWVLLVYHDFQILGSRFIVRIDNSEVIDELRDKIKGKKPEAFSRLRVDPDDITAWKTKGEMIIDHSTSLERLAKILKSINVDDVEAIERIREGVSLENLELSDGQTLLAQLPGSLLSIICQSALIFTTT